MDVAYVISGTFRSAMVANRPVEETQVDGRPTTRGEPRSLADESLGVLSRPSLLASSSDNVLI